MALDITVNRPLTTVTEPETDSTSAAVIEDAGGNWKLDLSATINAALRLLGRVRVTPETSGQRYRLKIEFLDFTSSGDATYAGAATTPFSDAEADDLTVVGFTPWVDLHALHNDAGDTTAS
ncbi:MAG: hypothetical protein AAF329_01035 [Cyanobacteria bacterium P01_A01_bin.17]